MGCDGINLCPHVGTNNFGLSLKKLEILPENMGQNQPSAYCLTIYRYANIVSFSKYRWNMVIAFFWTISHDIYLISTNTESPYR